MKMSRRWRAHVLLVSSLACAGQSARQAPDPLGSYDPAQVVAGEIRDFRPIYRQMGLAAAPAPIAFVGSAAFFASTTPDTTLTVVSISLPNRGLTFVREGDEYRATYEVTLTVRKDTTEVRRETGSETVRIGSFKEISRTDESIVFREVFQLAPGRYTLSYGIRDVEGSQSAGDETVIDVPRFDEHSVSKPVIVYEATPRTTLNVTPDYIASPRASAVFGIDTTVGVYLEAYGDGTGNVPIELSLRDSAQQVVWSDTVELVRHGRLASGTFDVPITNADIGIVTLATRRLSGATNPSAPVSRAPEIAGISTTSPLTTYSAIFVGFGPDLPVMTFDAMLHYLRFFAPRSLLKTLYDATPEKRGVVWADFLRATDRSPTTPQNEALLEYFARIREANFRFRGDGPEGWLTDRGSVFVGLGEPDVVYQDEGYLRDFSINSNQKMRFLIWEYQALQARLIFYDETWTGQWRLIPSSSMAFQSLLSRVISLR
jgi:GWxTD domain-containing protein